jgi:fatty acid desaturase
MVTSACFAARAELAEYEWDSNRKDWRRPRVDREVMKKLSERSTINGLLRVAWFVLLLAAAAAATAVVGLINLLLAVPFLSAYYVLYGFWVALAHELQHTTVFGEKADWFSEALFRFVHALVWKTPTYARVSHRLHHRYTMVQGVDPETGWPDVITTRWLQRFVLGHLLRILVVGALIDLARSALTQVERAAGRKNRMMREHCTAREVRAIRIVSLWHSTQYIGRPYDVNDHRLNTRSIRVSGLVRSTYWGLDDHVDHHLYPVVPSRHLPKLHRLLERGLAVPDTIVGCWAEMFRIAREKDRDPKRELVSVGAAGR